MNMTNIHVRYRISFLRIIMDMRRILRARWLPLFRVIQLLCKRRMWSNLRSRETPFGSPGEHSVSDQAPPKRTEKLQIMLDDQELKTIDDWRFENRLPSRAAAIRELIRRGLAVDDQLDPPEEAPSTEFRVVEG